MGSPQHRVSSCSMMPTQQFKRSILSSLVPVNWFIPCLVGMREIVYSHLLVKRNRLRLYWVNARRMDHANVMTTMLFRVELEQRQAVLLYPQRIKHTLHRGCSRSGLSCSAFNQYSQYHAPLGQCTIDRAGWLWRVNQCFCVYFALGHL